MTARELLRRGLAAHVAGEALHLGRRPEVVGDFSDGLGDRVLRTAVHNYAGALAGQGTRDREADTGGAAAHECGLACELEVHDRPDQ